ncbi:MAG: hypothetical protein OEY89_15235 [Gammaproteobacteria bacterium]|nr:hypothetical protein [Gammaproteobacteria bacterium]
MIKIIHRVNEIEQLTNLDCGFGVEMDIHAYGSELVVHHDPFKKGVLLAEWIKYYKHSFIILNVKEEGVENEVLKIIKKYRIENYFFLDLTFPALYKMQKAGEKNIAYRVSEHESVAGAYSLSGKINWIWLDCFYGFPISFADYEGLKYSGYKICLVSPELHGRRSDEIELMKKYMNIHNMEIDAVCTKFPELW